MKCREAPAVPDEARMSPFEYYWSHPSKRDVSNRSKSLSKTQTQVLFLLFRALR